MAAYAPLPGGLQTACAFKDGYNDSRDSVSVRAQSPGGRDWKEPLSTAEPLRHDVARTGDKRVFTSLSVVSQAQEQRCLFNVNIQIEMNINNVLFNTTEQSLILR